MLLQFLLVCSLRSLRACGFFLAFRFLPLCRTMEAARLDVVLTFTWDFNFNVCTLETPFIKNVVCIWVGYGLRHIDTREPSYLEPRACIENNTIG